MKSFQFNKIAIPCGTLLLFLATSPAQGASDSELARVQAERAQTFQNYYRSLKSQPAGSASLANVSHGADDALMKLQSKQTQEHRDKLKTDAEAARKKLERESSQSENTGGGTSSGRSGGFKASGPGNQRSPAAARPVAQKEKAPEVVVDGSNVPRLLTFPGAPSKAAKRK